MKIAIVLLLAITLNAIKVDTTVSHGTQKHIESLKQSHWGSTILELAELHSLAGGVLQDLVGSIEEMIAEMNQELEELQYDFGIRTNEHNSLVLTHEQDIQDADIDISRSEDTLNNLLIPRRAQLKARIDSLIENQDYNRKTLDETNLLREQAHEDFEAQVAELNDATAAVDEALALISQLSNPSLVQIKKFQNSLRKIEARIQPHAKHAPLIKALITLASEQNFSDQGVIGQIVNALNEFRNAVVDAINAATANEAAQVEEHAERVLQLDDEYAEFQRQINKVNVDLTATQDKIDQFTSFIAQRQSDRATSQALLDLENEQYAEEAQIFSDLQNKYQRDIAVTEEAYQMVKSVDFSQIKV